MAVTKQPRPAVGAAKTGRTPKKRAAEAARGRAAGATQKAAKPTKKRSLDAPKRSAAKALERVAAKVSKQVSRARGGLPGKGRKKLPPVDAAAIAGRLAVALPEPGHELSFRTPFELLIATILAAQSTDRTVNQVMPTLLARYPTARELAAASQQAVEELVKRTGFFRNKARAIREASQQLVYDHAGEVPNTMAALTQLPGVARKTANVVLGTAFGINAGFIVDTHVARVTQRLGLTQQVQPERIEEDLCRQFEQSAWTDLAHRFTLHGRYTCLAKRPMCADCPLNELCRSREEAPSVDWEARALREHTRVRAGIASSQATSP
jgi:endonuclease III